MIPSRLPSKRASAAVFAASALLAFSAAAADIQVLGAEKITASGVAKTETRTVSGFHGVALAVPADVMLRQGDSEGVSVTGDDNIVPLVETVVENETLKIRWVRKVVLSGKPKTLQIVVSARNVDAVAVMGSGQIRADALKAGTMHAAIDGSGAITFAKLDADSLNAAIHGNGRLTAAGRADSLDVAIAGSGDLAAAKLQSRRARITLNGSAQATVWARDALKATIAGSGEIKYYGKPQLTQTIAGSGSIRQAGDAS